MAFAVGVYDEDDGQGALRARTAMAQANRVIDPSISGVSHLQQLLRVPAEWDVIDNIPCRGGMCGPRLQSRRRRGVAPVYPIPVDPATTREGVLFIFPGGVVLEPLDSHRPCVNIARSTIVSATFYRDAFEVTLFTRERVVVRTEAVEDVDSIFQAYFWNPVM